MALSVVPFVSPSTGFGAMQMVVGITAENDGAVCRPVYALITC